MNTKKVITGVFIMLVGAFLLLSKMSFFNFCPWVYPVIISWQMLLICIGIILLFDRPSDHKTGGLVLILIGVLFLLPKIPPYPSISGFIIPVIVIIIGIAFIFKAATRKNEVINSDSWFCENSNWRKNFKEFGKNMTIDGEAIVRKEYVFSGSKEKWTQGKLKNLEIEAVFSGVEIDFTQAELADDIKVAACIRVKSVFSGVILYVPEDWNIMIRKSGVFGGFTDNRPNRVLQVADKKLVILELEAVFGGGEIKCYE